MPGAGQCFGQPAIRAIHCIMGARRGVVGGNMLGIKKNLQRMEVKIACSKVQQEATMGLMVDKL